MEENILKAGAGVTYSLEVATDAAFSAIVVSETALTATSFTASGLMTNTIHYWRILAANNCGTGAYSETFSFQTSNCQIINSTDVPVSIPASGTPVVTSTLSVSELGNIADINVVTLSGTHSYITDLVITLTSPAGTAVNLFSAICDGENDFNIQFDDAATNPYTALPCPPIDGEAYQPNGSLTSLNGENPNGTWTLTVQDNANVDGGFLNTWAIEICSDPSASLFLNCPTAATEASCQTQDDLDAAFASWLASATVSGDCPATITNDASAAPRVCAGGSTTVNFTAMGDCDVVTCSAVFSVDAPVLTINCPADQIIGGVQTQAEIDAAFATWLANATLSGGCNATLNNDATAAPDANTGGSVTVTFAGMGDCATETCTGTFTYQPPSEGCQVFGSTDVPIIISEIGTPTITSTLSVSGLSAITDINVIALSGEHTYISDLRIDLTSPAGTTVNLLFGICGSQDNFDVQFDDAAANPYSALPCPPVDGAAYQPNSALLAFNGEDPNGIWTLTIEDTANADGGSLNTWALEICTDTPPELVLSCPADRNEPACETQAAIDATFSAWLASVTATGCVATITNDAGAAPDVCTGGSVTVNFTATGDCGTATCSAVFAAAAPSSLAINCPLDENQPAGQTQATIDAAFGTWLASASMTGGCNATLSNDATVAPDVTTGGAATVTFIAAGDCSAETCIATFSVEAPDDPCPVNEVISATYTTGNILVEVSNNITSTEVISGDADVSYSAGVSIDLNADFEVTQGAQFHGYIQGCVAALHSGTSEEARISIVQHPGKRTLGVGVRLHESKSISIDLHNVSGALVAKLVESIMLERGGHTLELDASGLVPGIYYCKIQIGSEVVSKKLVIRE